MQPPDSTGIKDSPPGTGVIEHGGIVIAGKFYPAATLIDFEGQMIGSRPSYSVFYTPVTVALNLEIGQLFNAHASAVIRVRGIWLMPTNTSIAGIQLGIDVNRISSVGSTGSTVETPRPYDANFAAVPAGITARRGSTAGAALVYKYWTQYIFNDELSPSIGMISLVNQLPTYGDRVEDIVLRPSQGVQVKIGALSGTAAGLMGAKIDFVVDN
jgi:hypothetical protein